MCFLDKFCRARSVANGDKGSIQACAMPIFYKEHWYDQCLKMDNRTDFSCPVDRHSDDQRKATNWHACNEACSKNAG